MIWLSDFERGSMLQPKDSRFPLMVASCYKNLEQKQEALKIYERIAQMDPNSKTCLEQLVNLCNEMGYSAKAEHYQHLYHDLIDRLAEMQREESQYARDNRYQEYNDGYNYSRQQANNPMEFRSKNDQALDVGLRVHDEYGGNPMERKQADNQNDEIFKGFDIDIPDDD